MAFEELTRVTTAKGEYLAYHKRHRGKSAVDTLPELLGGVLRDLAFPKQMHWDAKLDDGRGELLFGRPIRWLLFLYGGRVVPFTIGRTPGAAGAQVLDVETGALTYGHRVLATSGRAGRSIKVRSFDEYRARLAEHFVVLEHTERRDRIARDLEAHARRLGGRVQLKQHAALLEEVADLVEYPGVVAGFFDRGFLALPQEVLTTTLVHHQHYFPVVTDGGELREAFLAIVNTRPADERVIAKNAERVVTARLRDAKFFWESDRKATLESRLERLHTLLFHKKLGSYRDKAERISSLAGWIASEPLAHPADASNAATAARLAKTDLTSDMVFEFTELQGTIGGIYAREEGLPEAVWKAIYYQYLPIGVEADAPPSRQQLGAAATTWAAVSLADKLDTFVSLSRAGERATGSRDPFGLRRQTQGAVRILMDLPELTGIDREIWLGPLLASGRGARARHDRAVDRRSRGGGARVRDRTRPLRPGAPRIHGRSRACRHARTATSARCGRVASPRRSRACARRRISRRWRCCSSGSRTSRRSWRDDSPLDREALVEPAERALLEALDLRRPRIEAAVARSDYRAAFVDIAGLRAAVDRFFTEVFVMADDVRIRNVRLKLMADLRDLILHLADISEIIPQTE